MTTRLRRLDCSIKGRESGHRDAVSERSAIRPTGLSPGDTDTTGNTTGKNNMGAAFNRSFLMNEPGAYVHNSKYAKRLIYDSIDWVDDNELNYSVGKHALCRSGPAAACPAVHGAMTYLLPNGVRPGACGGASVLTHTQEKEVLDTWNEC